MCAAGYRWENDGGEVTQNGLMCCTRQEDAKD